MCQVETDLGLVTECVGGVAVLVVTGWALTHVVAVWYEPRQVVDELLVVGIGFALLAGLALIHQ